MTFVDVLGLLGTGVLAGVVSTLVSLASIVSFPILLAFGFPPLAANVTNTVALVFTGLGAVAGSRPELAGRKRQVLALGWLSALGGAVGAGVLLLTPARAFEAVAPWLVGAASLVLLRPRRSRTARPRLDALTDEKALPRQDANSGQAGHPEQGGVPGQGLHRGGSPGRALKVGVFAVAIYVGYFGAAGGIMMFAVLAAALEDSPARLNAIKNALSALANGVAAIGFALFGPVQWGAAIPLAAGFLIGGRLGPPLARRLPGQTLRVVSAVAGLLVALKLGFDAYV
ncbi:sulfite exporter TauE/SafE family protein [Sphaerisporangium album]|uniref:Probable membrane transporter protein n=1 Tax=Sphaerisporangium album TaxID=509200 RepID=A0A367FBM4_9ACTN|nr:sulfite exporter TauE/SafE family protein [Sphaerisporangium album]RCG27095.1 sulfite exporter TauE/SafE family protein [Sphaerisporangium album]